MQIVWGLFFMVIKDFIYLAVKLGNLKNYRNY